MVAFCIFFGWLYWSYLWDKNEKTKGRLSILLVGA